MPPSATFDDLLTAIDRLTPEDQAVLIDIVRRRLSELGRQRVIAEVKQARKEFKAGQCQPATPDDLLREITS